MYQQERRWLAAGVFERIAHDLRMLVRVFSERNEQPSAVIFDARTLQSTPESGGRACYDGHKKKNGSKVHIAVDTLGNLLALHVSAANEDDRAMVVELAESVQAVTDTNVKAAFVDQGYTGVLAHLDAEDQGIELILVKHREAKRGFLLLPRRWVMERAFGWLGRFRRLTRDYERLPETLAGWHWVAFIALMLGRLMFQSAYRL